MIETEPPLTLSTRAKADELLYFQALYNFGARKIAVFNVGPLGCIPSQLANQRSVDGSCIQFINDYVQGFNRALGLKLNDLATTLTGSTLVYGNSYDLVFDKVVNPQRYGTSLSLPGLYYIETIELGQNVNLTWSNFSSLFVQV